MREREYKRMMELKERIELAKRLIDDAEAILITAGAGMGVDSGLPDFRGENGFWRAYPSLKEKGLHFEDMATPKLFQTNPSLAWAFYGHRLHLYRETIPHEGFHLLRDLVHKKMNNYFIFTSNVDGQFQKAGFDEDAIVEVHGSIHYMQCTQRCNQEIWSAHESVIDVDMEQFLARTLPICPYCHSLARPNILMFGDWNVWNSKRFNRQIARYNTWIKKNKSAKMVIIEIGAGTAIPTIRYEGEKRAKQLMNTAFIRINPSEWMINTKIKIAIELPLGGKEGLKMIIGN